MGLLVVGRQRQRCCALTQGRIFASILSGTVSTGTAHHNNRGRLSGRGIAEARVAEAMGWWGRGGATAAAAADKHPQELLF